MTKETITRKEYQLNNINLMKQINDIKDDIGNIKINIAGLPDKIKEAIAENYVSKDSFRPVQKVVYGLVGAILIGVAGAILALAFK